MSYSRENNDFSGLQIQYFPLQCQLESQPDNCFKSPMPKFQSWSILGTQLTQGLLKDQCFSNAESSVLTHGHFSPTGFPVLPQPSPVEFSCIPYSIVLGKRLSCSTLPFIPCLLHYIITSSYLQQYPILFDRSMFFILTFLFPRSSK